MGETQVSISEPKVLIIEADTERGRELESVLRFINCEPVLTTDCSHWNDSIDDVQDVLAVLVGSCKTDKVLQKLLKEVHDLDEHLPIFLLSLTISFMWIVMVRPQVPLILPRPAEHQSFHFRGPGRGDSLPPPRIFLIWKPAHTT